LGFFHLKRRAASLACPFSRWLVGAVPRAALPALEHPERPGEGRFERLNHAGVLLRPKSEVAERAGETDTVVLVLVLDDHGAGRVLEDAEVDVPVDGFPLAGVLLATLLMLVAEVEVAHSRGHAVHGEEPSLGQAVGEPGLERVLGA